MIKLLAIVLVLGSLSGCGSQQVNPNSVEQSSEKSSESVGQTGENDQSKNLEVTLTSAEEQNDETISKLKLIEKKMRSSGKYYLTFFTSDLYLKASRAAIDGNVTLALTIFRYLHTVYPKDLFLQKRLAIALIRVGKVSEALKHLKEVYAKDHYRDEKIGLLLAGVYGALSQQAAAEEIYKSILKRNPKSEEACLFLSKSFFEREQYTKAFENLDECEKRIKTAGLFDYQKGIMYKAIGKTDKAIFYLERSMKNDPENYQSFLELGQIYENKKNWDKALAVYEKYCKRDPTRSEVLNKVVKILFTKEKFKDSIPYLKILSEMEGDNLNIKMKLGLLYIDAGNYDDAKKIFIGLLKEVPNSDKVLFYLGSIYSLTHELEKALFVFRKIEKESSFYKDSGLQVVRILSYMALQNDEYKSEFLATVDQYAKDLPEENLTIKMIAASYYELSGHYDKAIESVLSVKTDKGFEVNHEYYLATLYDKNDQTDESRKLVKDIVDKNPSYAQAWNFLGYSMLDKGENIEEAYSFIQKALKISPNDAFIRDSLGWYYYKTGKYERALKEVLYAHKKIGDDLVIFKHLALIYKAMNKDTLAKKYFKRAMESTQSEKDKEELVQRFGPEEIISDRTPATTTVNK